MKKLFTLFLLLAAIPAFSMQMVSTKISTAQSMGGSFKSTGLDVSKVNLAGIQAVWAGGGSPVGDFSIEVSNDEVDAVGSVTNWTTYSGSVISITTDGDLFYNLANIGFRYIRLSYARTSGTGTLNAILITKL